MKINFNYKSALIVVLFITQISIAQKKDENIGTEVVNVVKPYTPSISDAFKVKETPSFEDEETSKKEVIQYTIFSFPVASTFMPSKGKAANVDQEAKEKLFSNYLTLGAGNYGAINAELFVTQTLENNDYVGAMIRHLSSQGGIKNAELEDKFFNTSLDFTYGSKAKKMAWYADAGYQNQVYNWYGVQPNFLPQPTLDGINPQQTYHNAYAAGRLSLNESALKETTIQFSRFWDAFASGENHFVAKPSLSFDVMNEKIKTNFIVDYINGSFQKDYSGLGEIKYGYTNIGFSPSFQINKDELAVNIGASFFYSISSIAGNNKFLVYPNITASYKLVGDLMIAYAGAEGTLKQNSFHDFVASNFFISPTIAIAPTDQKYDVYIGLKGKLANAIAYNIRGSIKNEDNKVLFKNNEYIPLASNKEGYQYGNSFGLVYDNVKTVSFFGELKADFSKNVTFGVNGTFSSYSQKNQSEAWNLPSIELGANLDVKFNSKWYAGSSLFFVGERKDQLLLVGFVTSATDVTLKSYFDLNAHLGYKHNDRLTFFLKGNNLANQSYQRWINYPVQGLQILLGANYKFDF